MIMKKLFTIFIFSLLSFSLKAQWVELDTGMENPPVFNDVYAITPDIVVVVGADGTILKTTDGGETWVQKDSGTTNGLNKIQFPTPEVGYIVGDSGLLKTTDGGETWSAIETGEITDFSGLSCVDEDLIFISGYTLLLKSENGGNSFTIINTDIDYYYPQIQFLNTEIGFTWDPSTYNFILLKTENGGETWDEVNGESPIHFLDEDVGFYYSSGLFKTIDSGENFNIIEYG